MSQDKYALTDPMRKACTEYGGECWHEWEDEQVFPDVIWRRCKNCKRASPFPMNTSANVSFFEPWINNRLFTGPNAGNDMVWLKEAIERKGEWAKFMLFCDARGQQIAGNTDYELQYMCAFTLDLMHPARFCWLVAQALEAGVLKGGKE